MLVYGGNLTGFSVVNYFARNVDNLLIGKYWGADQLGLYSRAYQLLMLPIRQFNSPISAVAVPALSKLAGDPNRYRQAYLRILEKIAIVTMPGTAFVIVSSDWLVHVALGPRWSEVGRIFALLALSALVQPLANTTGWLFLSQDRTRDLLRWGMVGATVTVVAIVVGLPWGSTGVAASYSIAFLCLATPLLFWFVGRKGPVGARDFYRTAAPSFYAALAVLGALVGLRRVLGDVNPLTGLGVSFGCAVVVAVVALSLSAAGRRALRDLLSTGRLLTQRW
jgi:PST family polysaccharide transporter